LENKRSKDLTFVMVGHAHIDPVWLWDWREGYETVKGTFRSALDRLKENPDMVFAHSSASHYHWMEDHPSMLAEIKEAVARGQWEPVGGWWVEPDANVPSGEALARQGLYGQRYFEKTLGRRAKVAFLPDTFGHPGTLPQLIKQAGMDYFVFMRPGASEIDLPSNLFTWEGPDGTQMLTARVECYNTNPLNVTTSVERNLDWRPVDAKEWIGIYGVGNHGGGPTKKAVQSIRETNADPEWPTLVMGSLEGFFDRATQREHPVVSHELQHHARGCYSAYSLIKQLNRQGEEGLLAAEKWTSFASFLGYQYPTEKFEYAWRRVLFNQFHDILAGSSVPSAYEDSKQEIGEALSGTGRVMYGALQTIAQRIDTRRDKTKEIEEPIRRVRYTPSDWTVDLGDGVPVVVFNPNPWPRREIVEVETNEWGAPEMMVLNSENKPVLHQLAQPESVTTARPRVTWIAEVPPLGYRVYRLVDEAAPGVPEDAPPLTASASVLENRWWKLEICATTGTIKSLRDKQRGLELLAGLGAQLVVIDDPTDTWGHGITSMRRIAGVFEPCKVELVEEGPVRATVRITYDWGMSTARQEITIYRETPAIHGRLTVDWHEQHKALKLAFPWALDETKATYSVPYGHAVRPADGQEEPLQQWFDVTGQVRDHRGVKHPAGVAMLNDCKYGGDVLGGEMRLTILRSPVFAHHDPQKLKPGVMYPYQDQGEQSMRWALVPHAGSWADAGVVEAAHDLNAPMHLIREYAHKGDLPGALGFVEVTPPGQVVVTAVKQAEEGDDLVVRLYEPAGRQVKATVKVPLAGAEFAVEAGPFQVKTYRVSRQGGQVREVNFLEEEA
jgi:alpha-mannosidase